mgnify:CR=1 FL=1
MRPPDLQQAIRKTKDGGLLYPRSCARVLAAEVERLEKRENELINALDMGQINCDAVYDELREERDDARARDDAAVKLKVAAAQFPAWAFWLVWRKAGAWQQQRILA